MASKQPVLGIDVGGTNLTAGLVNEKNKIVARHKIDTEADQGEAHVIERIASCVNELLDDAKYKLADIAGIGLGIPGAVNPAAGVVLEAVNLRWTDMPVAKQLAKQVDLPITLDNDVNVGAWGEYEIGAAKDAKGVLAIFVGTGIGGGIILNGELYTGVYGTAGEIGHMIVDTHGPLGSRTLERLASRTSVVNRLHTLVNANVESNIKELSGSKWPRIRSKALRKALASDDPLTLRVLRDAAKVIGHAAASCVTLLSLDCVVIGGGLTEALDERWIGWINEAFQDAVFPPVCRQCKLVESKLGDDAGLLGAALLARKRLT